MSEPLYTVVISQLANGKWRWSVATRDCDDHPLWDGEWQLKEVSRDRRTFKKASRAAARFVAECVDRDIGKELADSFESNSPIAQAGVA